MTVDLPDTSAPCLAGLGRAALHAEPPAAALHTLPQTWFARATFEQLSRVTRLVLQSGTDLAAADISALPQLQALGLIRLQMGNLPTGVADLRHLSVLDVTGNLLTSLPHGPYLSGLRQLSLAGNPIRALPPALGVAAALEALDLTGCAPLDEAGMLTKARRLARPCPTLRLRLRPRLRVPCKPFAKACPFAGWRPLCLQLPNLRALYAALELGWTAQNSVDMPINAHEKMMNELDSLEVCAHAAGCTCGAWCAPAPKLPRCPAAGALHGCGRPQLGPGAPPPGGAHRSQHIPPPGRL